MIIKVLSGQTIQDIAYQYYGSIDYVNKIIQDNNLIFGQKLLPSQELVIDNSNISLNIVRKDVILQSLEFVSSNEINIDSNYTFGDFNEDFNIDFLN